MGFQRMSDAVVEAMMVDELQQQKTPPKRLVIVPKKGHGCKMSIYANNRTAPLQVTVDLLDTLLQRLTHRVRAFIWSYARDHEKEELEVVRNIRLLRDPSVEQEQLGGELNQLTYMDLVRIVEGEIHAEAKEEDDDDDEEDQDGPGTARVLKDEYAAAKMVVAEQPVGVPWINSVLQLAECSILLADADNLDDLVPFSTGGLRKQMLRFLKSTKQQCVQEARLFGCLLCRDFSIETIAATQLEDDVDAFNEDGKRVNAAPKLVLPQKPLSSLPVEQPLYGPKALSCNNSALKDREIILEDLEDVVEDNERSIQALAEVLRICS